MADKDFLDELVEQRTAKNPEFPRLVEEAAARRLWARPLVQRREELKLSQTQVAAQMRTSASVVSKLEGGADVKLSTVQRYLAAIQLGLPDLPVPVAKPRRLVAAR
jgi:DNA-binding transcriptional regulator YiaG